MADTMEDVASGDLIVRIPNAIDALSRRAFTH